MKKLLYLFVLLLNTSYASDHLYWGSEDVINAMDEVHSDCTDKTPICMFIAFRYGLNSHYKKEDGKIYGALYGWADVLMIRFQQNPWLGAANFYPGLGKSIVSLFPFPSGNRTNGFKLPFLITGKEDSITQSSHDWELGLEVTHNIYEAPLEMKIGTVKLPKLESERELIKTTSLQSPQLLLGWALPLSLNEGVKLTLNSHVSQELNSLTIAGVPNPHPIADNQKGRGIPFVPTVVRLAREETIYDIVIENKEGLRYRSRETLGRP